MEYWNPHLQVWFVGHEGLELKDPATYVQKLAKRGTLARATVLDTGEVLNIEGDDLL